MEQEINPEIELRKLEIKDRALEIEENRLLSCPDWYKHNGKRVLNCIHEWKFNGENGHQGFGFSGLLGEVLFRKACEDNSSDIFPSTGYDDIWGYDFITKKDGLQMYFDVTINASQSSLRKKISQGTYPTVFLPWYIGDSSIFDNNHSAKDSYLRKYIQDGIFDSKLFLSKTITINTEILRYLKLIRNGGSVSSKMVGRMNEYSADGLYISNYENVISLIKDIIFR